MTELTTFEPILDDASDAKFGSETIEIKPGSWYWVDKTDTKPGWFGCVTHVGSNYMKLEGPSVDWDSSKHTTRVHFDDYWTRLIPVENHQEVIQRQIAHFQSEATILMREITELTSHLGLSAGTGRIGGPKVDTSGTSLAILSGQDDLKKYKTELELAKKETLPKLFEQVKHKHNMMASWMKSEAIGLEALVNPMKASLKEIDGKIFNISLYAGLAEDSVECRSGDPAGTDEKLHIMQRRLYMDEECLLQYEAGGMEFSNIGEFDQWLARDENMKRLLPYPRTMVGFRVRRNEKTRYTGSMVQAFVNIRSAINDTYTFFYIRNGDQLWRIVSELEFGTSIFPDRDTFDPTRPLMAKKDQFFSSDRQTMTRDLFDEIMESEYPQAVAAHEKWKIDTENGKFKIDAEGNRVPVNGFSGEHNSPYLSSGMSTRGMRVKSWSSGFNPDEWQLLDQNHLFFDDYMETIKDQFDTFNRIALIVQGLFDRSMVLHPHYPVRIWQQDSFVRSIELIYDNSNVLYDGEKPDFEAYRKRLNAQIDENSFLCGQDQLWGRIEAQKDYERQQRGRYREGLYEQAYHQPYGNPGPGEVSKPSSIQKKARKATFRWERKRLSGDYWERKRKPMIETTFTANFDQLFNVSAYKPGDFKQFFSDYRTRQEYLKWAYFLLTAENFHAGKHQNSELPSWQI